ncbi:MAG: hypothetical protein OXL37_06270 [Chloroflexota bacterium]|nr:hypothetical protein [Chloroflexota bacterium]MDE2959916.1 hypothetical protein [Chloroflexota bacterium]
MQPDGRNLNWLEVSGVLARLGIEEIERFGGYAVYISALGDDVITVVVDGWDVPFDDLAFNLSKIGISRVEIEAALESLYTDH